MAGPGGMNPFGPKKLYVRAMQAARKMKQVKRDRKLIKPLKEWTIFRGDTVQVMEGKDSGYIGKVLKVKRKLNQVIVEGANMARKHLKSPTPGVGVIVDLQRSLDVSKVSLLDPQDGEPTTVYFSDALKTPLRADRKGNVVEQKEGQTMVARARFSTRSHLEIPVPVQPPRVRMDGPKDTKAEMATKVTWKPDIRYPPIPPGCYF